LSCGNWLMLILLGGAAVLGSTAESGSKCRVFGVSLRKCLRRDVEHGRGRSLVSPSSESSLLDALSLQSAGTSRVPMPPRLNAQRLFDERYCATTLFVPHVLRVCCQHLKTHGTIIRSDRFHTVQSGCFLHLVD